MTVREVERKVETPAHVIAFATHGLMSKESEEMTGIAEPSLLLSRQPGAPVGDQWLTTSKIERLSLDADLVILSACNTAAPGDQDGESLSGIARAFFEAGARGVLVTNWHVDAAATRDFLIQFAVALRAPSVSVAEALRNAMISSMLKHPSPRDWAMFSYVGS
jgi:CHAT domain-containing protein